MDKYYLTSRKNNLIPRFSLSFCSSKVCYSKNSIIWAKLIFIIHNFMSSTDVYDALRSAARRNGNKNLRILTVTNKLCSYQFVNEKENLRSTTRKQSSLKKIMNSLEKLALHSSSAKASKTKGMLVFASTFLKSLPRGIFIRVV